jgi:hypothetical protein
MLCMDLTVFPCHNSPPVWEHIQHCSAESFYCCLQPSDQFNLYQVRDVPPNSFILHAAHLTMVKFILVPALSVCPVVSLAFDHYVAIKYNRSVDITLPKRT